MIREYQSKAGIWIGIGIGLLAVALLVRTNGAPFLALIFMLVGAGLFVRGCALYARAKGQPDVLGLLGLLGIVGLVILLVLPDKTNEGTGVDPAG